MHVFWYGVIALLWAGFFVLEGLGLGAGALLPLVGRSDQRRQEVTELLAPAWDGNEAWLLAAGTATFFAYRGWFDGLLTGFTAWFASILIALFTRACALSARDKARTLRGRRICDGLVFLGSAGPAFVLGLLFANFLRGVDIDGGGSVRSEIESNFSWYAVLGGVVSVLVFAMQGAAFLTMHTRGDTHRAARRAMWIIAPLSASTTIGWMVWTEAQRGGLLSRVLAAGLTLGVLTVFVRTMLGHTFRAFAAAAATAVVLPLWVFGTLWPNVLVARNSAALSLTVHNTAASTGALAVLTIVGVEVGAVVVVYLTWSYWIFHSRVTGKQRVEAAQRELNRAHQPARRRFRRPVLTKPMAPARVLVAAGDVSGDSQSAEI